MVTPEKTEPTVVKEPSLMPPKGKAVGHYIRHATTRSAIHLTPLLHIPMITNPGHTVYICPTCQVHHPVKTMHIWCDDTGLATVGGGIIDRLREATPPMDGFVIEGSTDNPPPLKIGQGHTREKVDYSNRAQVIYSEPNSAPQVIIPVTTI